MNELAILSGQAVVPVDQVKHQVGMIHNLMKKVMKQGEHFGTVPGCGPKKTLLKPGAEKIAFTFRLAPKYEFTVEDLPNGHRAYDVTCRLYTIGTDIFVGEGSGYCSTMESKYRYRKAERNCPVCGKEGTIIKGKAEYGGGWLCFKNKGGCGAKFHDGDSDIEQQEVGKLENDNPADQYNTVKKMGMKRAFISAVLTATAASDVFTQDIEDLPEELRSGIAPEQTTEQAAAAADLAAELAGATSPVMDGVELASDEDVKEISTLLKSAKKSSDDLIAYYHMELGRDDINRLQDFTKADLVEIRKMLNKKTKAA